MRVNIPMKACAAALTVVLAGFWDCGGGEKSATAPPPKVPTLTVDSGGGRFQPDSVIVLTVRLDGPASQVQVVLTASDTGLARLRPVSDVVDRDSVTVAASMPGWFPIGLHLGDRPGQVVVRVSVPSLKLADSSIITMPNSLLRLLYLTPMDTAAYVGDTFRMQYQAWNDTGYAFATITYATDRPDVLTFLPGNRVRPIGIGRARIIGSAPGSRYAFLVDTTYISVVPPGELTAWLMGNTDRIVRLTAKGTVIQAFTLVGAKGTVALSWMPNGRDFLVQAIPAGYNPGDPTTLFVADTTGVAQPFFVANAPGVAQASPSPSADGSWVYFGDIIGNLNNSSELWRVHADGTAPELVGDTATGLNQFDVYPSVSPDGTLLAYASNRYKKTNWTNDLLRVRHLASGLVDSFQVTAYAPHWSPTGAVLAIESQDLYGQISLINPDGSGLRQLTGAGWLDAYAWSPDGRWLVGLRYRVPCIVNVLTGEQLPLTFAAGYTGITWRR